MADSFPMDNRKECLDFLNQPGLQRMWPLVRKKYESYGRVAGSIRLSGLREEERQALEGLFAVNMIGRSDFRFQMRDLEQALQETRFRLSVADCLDLLYGDGWATRQQVQDTAQQLWGEFCQWAMDHAGNEGLQAWAGLLREGNGLGYRTFLECYREYCETGTSLAWIGALRALRQLPAKDERLPVFAARTTGDPHGLDRSTLAGRIFYWGMLALQGHDLQEQLTEGSGGSQSDIPLDFDGEMPDLGEESLSQAEAVRGRYSRAGILLDDISSIVWVAGWGDKAREPVALPLWTVETLGSAALPPVAEVCVVENPSIFGALVDCWSKKGTPLPFPLVCTSGQPSLAALKLLDRMTDAKARIYYSGDFDVKGVQMAIGLSQRYGARFVPWRFDVAAYQAADHSWNPIFSEGEIESLQRMRVPWDNRLVSVMRETGRKVFQEQILELLRKDWEEREMG